MTRIGDSEREAAAARLSAHAAAGRLSVEELEERLERAHRAVHDTDLVALERDLPGAPDLHRRRPAAAWRPVWPVLPIGLLVLGVAVTIAVGHPVAPLFIGLFLLWRLRWAPARF
jgi:hypothetical protein